IARRHLSPSTYRRLRVALSSSGDLVRHVGKNLRHNGRLRDHCRGRTDLILNVGCGPVTAEGWVNIDINPPPRAFYYDALDPLPIASETVRHIHCEHFLEHLCFDDARAFLHECYRVLEPFGSLRIIVPDVEKYMRAYATDDKTFFT